jgi:hypothetical protein
MTVLEALNTSIGDLALSNKNLVLRGLDPDEVFSLSNSTEVEIAKAFCLRDLLTNPDFSEDGLSITYNRPAMIKEMERIFLANGLDNEIIDFNPIIHDRSGLW